MKYILRGIAVFIAVFTITISFSACVRVMEAEENDEIIEISDEFFTPEYEEESKTHEAENADVIPLPEKKELPEEEETVPKKEEESLPDRMKITYVSSLVDGLNVRSGAGTGYSVLGRLDKGDMVAYYGENGGWYETRYAGKKAYVSAKKEYTKLYETEEEDERTEEVIKAGCELLGTKYVYGAVRLHDGKGNFYKKFNKNEFDCSSLMQYIFYVGANELLYVNTRTQIFQGKSVKRDELKRGDLMFFTNSSRCDKSGIERVGHVGLYFGDGYILHTASDHAVIEKISAKRWSYFIEGRRI